MVTSTDSPTDSDARTSVQGTPVVPGLAHGPALVVRGEVDPAAIERFGDGGFPDAAAALAAYDDAAAAVADGFTRTASRATGAATEVLTASAGLARDKGLRSAVRKELNAGTDLVSAVRADGAMEIPAGARVLLDGTTGLVEVDPDETEAAARVARDLEDRAALDSWTGPGATADGTPVKLLANVADASSATTAAAGPVGGGGLLRTELSFLNRQDEPSVEEQADIYAGILEPFGEGQYVVVRTLDAGSDKPIAFATHEGEENPALGVRGLRLSFDNPG